MDSMIPTNASSSEAKPLHEILPHLAEVFIATGSLEGDEYVCDLENARNALLKLGYGEQMINKAFDEFCKKTDPTTNFLSIPAASIAGWKSLALALSGGGLRATIFELGIVLYLAMANELKNVKTIVSVSGGSILAAHLATRWKRATEDREGFTEVASQLIKFIRSDIRNSSMASWIWWNSLLVTLLVPSWRRRTTYLERHYKTHFNDATLNALPEGTNATAFIFVATDTIKQHRVALSRDGIRRFTFSGQLVDQPILAKGVHLSLAVTASSCFPPVFESLLIDHNSLGLRFDEFNGSLNLRDGGIAGNLGVEVLSYIVNSHSTQAQRMLVCDAECGLAEEPRDNLFSVLNAQGAALSDSARLFVQSLGPHAHLLRLASRPTSKHGLDFRALTKLSNFRTDLDAPSWQECYALLIHGAAICEDIFVGKSAQPLPTSDDVRTTIQNVLKDGGCSLELSEPSESSLYRCNRRSYWRLVFHIFLLVLLYCSVFEVLPFIYPDWAFRPLKNIWQLISPVSIIRLKAEDVLADIGTELCVNRTLASSQRKLVNSGLIRMGIIVGDNPSNSVFYCRKSIHPNNCDHAVDFEFTFRGDFRKDLPQSGSAVFVTGEIVKIAHSSDYKKVYIDLEDCTIQPMTSQEAVEWKDAPSLLRFSNKEIAKIHPYELDYSMPGILVKRRFVKIDLSKEVPVKIELRNIERRSPSSHTYDINAVRQSLEQKQMIFEFASERALMDIAVITNHPYAIWVRKDFNLVRNGFNNVWSLIIDVTQHTPGIPFTLKFDVTRYSAYQAKDLNFVGHIILAKEELIDTMVILPQGKICESIQQPRRRQQGSKEYDTRFMPGDDCVFSENKGHAINWKLQDPKPGWIYELIIDWVDESSE